MFHLWLSFMRAEHVDSSGVKIQKFREFFDSALPLRRTFDYLLFLRLLFIQRPNPEF